MAVSIKEPYFIFYLQLDEFVCSIIGISILSSTKPIGDWVKSPHML